MGESTDWLRGDHGLCRRDALGVHAEQAVSPIEFDATDVPCGRTNVIDSIAVCDSGS
jgi:hypothetical protein